MHLWNGSFYQKHLLIASHDPTKNSLYRVDLRLKKKSPQKKEHIFRQFSAQMVNLPLDSHRFLPNFPARCVVRCSRGCLVSSHAPWQQKVRQGHTDTRCEIAYTVCPEPIQLPNGVISKPSKWPKTGGYHFHWVFLTNLPVIRVINVITPLLQG